jgi:hypothetical protein
MTGRKGSEMSRKRMTLAVGIGFAFLLTTATPVLAQGQASRPEREVVLTLLPHGFDQPTVTVRPGRIRVVLKNRSYTDRTEFTLDREAGSRERSVVVQGARRGWRDVVELGVGRYLLTVNGYNKWRCTINVTASAR